MDWSWTFLKWVTFASNAAVFFQSCLWWRLPSHKVPVAVQCWTWPGLRSPDTGRKQAGRCGSLVWGEDEWCDYYLLLYCQTGCHTANKKKITQNIHQTQLRKRMRAVIVWCEWGGAGVFFPQAKQAATQLTQQRPNIYREIRHGLECVAVWS